MWKSHYSVRVRAIVGGLVLLGLSACESPSTDGQRVNPEQVNATALGEVHAQVKSPVAETDPPPVDKVAVATATLSQLDEMLSQFRGRVVVLDIWSTSCPPCMQEFRHLVELSERPLDELICVSLNVDYIGLPKRPPGEYLPAVSEFLTKQGARKVRNLLSADPDSDVLDRFEVEAIPAIIVFGKDGQVAARLTDSNASGEGLSYEADVLPLIGKLMSPE
jgi:thiol-disulfide isomerase/thioredoxin